jgi:SAM-dependent methyltransferase
MMNDDDDWNEIAGEWDDLATLYNQQLFQYYTKYRPQLLQYPPSTTGIIRSTTTTSPTTTGSTGGSSSSSSSSSRIIRIIDFGCGTGLFIEQLVQYYQTQFQQQQQQQPQQQASSSNIGRNTTTTTTTTTHVEILGIDTSSSMIQIVKEKIRNYGWNENVNDPKVGNNTITVTAWNTDLLSWNDHHFNNGNDYNTTTTTTTTSTSTSSNHGLSNILLDWYNTVDWIICHSVLSYLPPTFHVQPSLSSLSPLESIIQLFSQLLKPEEGYVVHADWTDMVPSSITSDHPFMTTLLRPHHDNTDPETTTTLNMIHNFINHNNNNTGILNEIQARQLYSIMTSSSSSLSSHNHSDNSGLEMISIESVTFPNVYHHHHHHSMPCHQAPPPPPGPDPSERLNGMDDTTIAGVGDVSSTTTTTSGSSTSSNSSRLARGSNVLIGIARRRR